MRKQRVEYTSPLEALIAVTKRLSLHEHEHHLSSEDFFDQYNKGLLSDSAEFVEWANDYQHYMALKLTLEESLCHVA